MNNQSITTRHFLFLLATTLLFACEVERIPESDWLNRMANLPADSLEAGHSYLSIYSKIFSDTEHRTHSLTATVSIRNVSELDTIYLTRANYYDTDGHLIRTYLENPNFVAPLETVEIVIAEKDDLGGSGANFLFDWAIHPGTPEPLFEGIMISTIGSQGLSFTTKGVRVW